MDVERERPLEREIDADGLVNGIARRHDNHQIDVALLVRLAVSIRAEQDDFVRPESFGNLAGKPPDRREGDVRRRIAVRLNVRDRNRTFLGHGAIVLHLPGAPLGLAADNPIWLDDGDPVAGWQAAPRETSQVACTSRTCDG
jgi:hypothetical protein